jgi:hypothetical protein
VAHIFSVVADYSLNDIPDPEIIVVSGRTAGTMAAAEDKRILGWLQKLTKLRSGLLRLHGSLIPVRLAFKGLAGTTHWYAEIFWRSSLGT